MPNTINRNWTYPEEGTKPYFIDIVSFFNEQDADVQALWDAIEEGVGGRKRAVINYVDNTVAPPTEVLADRYLLNFTGVSHVDWDGAIAGDIVEFNGTTWDALTPIEGDIVYVDTEDQDRQYVDDGSPAWEARPTASNYWTRTGSVVSPYNAGDGLAVTAVGEDIDLDSDSICHITAGTVNIDTSHTGTAEKINIRNGSGIATDAIEILADAGGISLLSFTYLNMSADSTAANAIKIDATAGGIDIDSVGLIDIASSTDKVLFTSGSVAYNSIGFTSAGGYYVDATNNIEIGTSAGLIRFSDSYRGASTYSSSIELSNATSEWNAFTTNFGDGISILSALNSSVGVKEPVTVVSTTPYVILSTDVNLLVNTSTIPITIQWPSAQIGITGRKVTIIDDSGNASINHITVTTEGSETILGEPDYIINGDYDAPTIITNGSNLRAK